MVFNDTFTLVMNFSEECCEVSIAPWRYFFLNIGFFLITLIHIVIGIHVKDKKNDFF